MQGSDRKDKLNSDKIKKLEQNLNNVSFLMIYTWLYPPFTVESIFLDLYKFHAIFTLPIVFTVKNIIIPLLHISSKIFGITAPPPLPSVHHLLICHSYLICLVDQADHSS